MARQSFVFACHERPDGDCLGAALAMARAFRGLGKDVTVLSRDPVPEHYRFLPESETVLSTTPRRDFDVGVLVDSDMPKRVGDAAEAVTGARMLACVDHHLSSEEFGEVRIVDRAVSSTCELVVDLFDANDVPIDRETATMLLAGIIFDTGGFRYSNASARTFEIVSRLAGLGASPSAIAREVFESRPLRSVKLLGRALSSMQASDDGRIVWAQITCADYRELDADDADTEGIVNSVAAVKGPQVAILFRETEPGTVRVSMR